MPKINNPTFFAPGYAILVSNERYSWLVKKLHQYGYKGLNSDINVYNNFRKIPKPDNIIIYLEKDMELTWTDFSDYKNYKDLYTLINLDKI